MDDDKNIVWWTLLKLIITFFSAYILYLAADNAHYSIPIYPFLLGVILLILMIKIWKS